MIKISKLADYGMIILNELTHRPLDCHSAAVLAECTGIALPTVSKVLKLLNEAGMITSSRGSSGGYRLVKDPKQLSLVEMITAVDGAPALTECCQPNNDCIHDSHCALRNRWQFINRVITEALSLFTLADLQQPHLTRGEISRRLVALTENLHGQ